MTVVFENKPFQVFQLIRGQTYERPRGEHSLKFDANNFNLKSKWPEISGEYGKLWAKTVKGANLLHTNLTNPSIKDVVLGVYDYHMAFVEENFAKLKEKDA